LVAGLVVWCGAHLLWGRWTGLWPGCWHITSWWRERSGGCIIVHRQWKSFYLRPFV
jgi:hypothetical protein